MCSKNTGQESCCSDDQDGTPWDKMITFRISELNEVTEGFQYYPKKK